MEIFDSENMVFDIEESFRVRKFFRNTALFAGLSDQAYEHIVEKARKCHYLEGHLLFSEGEQAASLFLLESGRIRIFKELKGYQVEITQIKAGDYFGEMAFSDMQGRAGNAEMMQNSTLWQISYSQIHQLFCDFPSDYTMLIMNISRELSRRLRRADQIIVNNVRRK